MLVTLAVVVVVVEVDTVDVVVLGSLDAPSAVAVGLLGVCAVGVEVKMVLAAVVRIAAAAGGVPVECSRQTATGAEPVHDLLLHSVVVSRHLNLT